MVFDKLQDISLTRRDKVLFAVCVMNLAWIAALSVFVLMEKFINLPVVTDRMDQ